MLKKLRKKLVKQWNDLLRKNLSHDLPLIPALAVIHMRIFSDSPSKTCGGFLPCCKVLC